MSILVVAAVVGVLGATPATGTATNITGTAVTPSTVTTGDATTISVSLTVEGVDTGDGTTDGSVTLSVPDAVNLSNTRTTDISVGPNASNNRGMIDVDARTVTVSWDDDTGTPGENFSISFDLEGIVVGRTGDTAVTAAVDADATGGAEVTATVGTITTIASKSDRSVTETPATLYFSEHDVDLTAISGANPAGSPQRFYGVTGEAEGVSHRQKIRLRSI
ncbi:hypothetical protein [Salinigranum rubrum]|uniref:hypothetical protein n=1 Tax=Salinigranum rubrum TaxID=755307 RepID=UPI0013A55972|nr:hypothetical protein [Salinigranum rubrum]